VLGRREPGYGFGTGIAEEVVGVQRGSDKHGSRVDEQLEHEGEGLTRSGRSTRAEEWADPEPAGEDQPEVDRAPDVSLVGGVPDGTTATDVEGRSQLAAALGKEVWPATGAALLSRARDANAPDRVLDLLARLPADTTFRNVQEVWTSLGGGAEQHRS
jgi:hypothetical protein